MRSSGVSSEPEPVRESWSLAALAALTMAALAARHPRYFYHWDEIQLQLAARRVDLSWHEPHPPGYHLFVLLERAVALVLPHGTAPGRALSTAAAGVLVCLAGARVSPRLDPWSRGLFRAAWALFLLGSPVLGTYAVASLTYLPEAAAWVAAILYVGHPRRGLWAFGAGLAGGLRPTVTLWALAAALVHDLRAGRISWRRWRVAAASLGAGVLLWWAPLVAESGGLRAYLRATGPVASGLVWSRSVFVLGPSVVAERLPVMLSELLGGLGLWVLLALWALRERARRVTRTGDALGAGAVLAFVFYLATIYDTDGYLASPVACLGGWALLVAAEGAAARSVASSRATALAAVALALGTLLAPGLLAPRGYEGHARYARHARWMDAHRATLRAYPPGSTVLVVAREYRHRGLRHYQWHLPEYAAVQLWRDPWMARLTDRTPYLVTRRGALEARGPATMDLATLLEQPLALRWVVLTDAEDARAFVDRSCAAWGQRRGRLLVYAVPAGGVAQAEAGRLRCDEPR
ncbi:MAG: hypothetical protein HY909_15460 [Deltaproteobacteria bacterium]|nr:hypothetical protein [Deltaproteobacteria bacterium]